MRDTAITGSVQVPTGSWMMSLRILVRMVAKMSCCADLDTHRWDWQGHSADSGLSREQEFLFANFSTCQQ